MAATATALFTETFRNQFLQDFAPADLIEHQLTCDLVSTRWRLLRCQSLENAILADPRLSAESQINALAKYSLYEHRLTRKFTQPLNQLRTLQGERKARREAELQQAVAIAAEFKATATPFDPPHTGSFFQPPKSTSASIVTSASKPPPIEPNADE